MELHIDIDRASGATLPHQIGRGLIEMICGGVLPPGTKLPASRTFADQLGVARLTVVEAYQWLADQGFVSARRGARAVVQEVGIASSTIPASRQAPEIIPSAPPDPPIRIDFGKVRPDLRAFPRRRWGSAIAAASRDLGPAGLDYGDPLGHMPLREALSSYLRRSRSLIAAPRNIVITSGSGQSLDVVLRALPDHRDVALERPGHALILRLMALHQARMIETPVDHDGIRTDLLPDDVRKRIVLVTPSHQFPTGARMSLARRRALIAWASRTDAFIFEDDYDSEFAYDGRPPIPLAGIDRTGRVVYMGTFSKSLAPGLRLGFMVLPDALLERVAEIKLWCDWGGGVIQQEALARWIDDGSFERHLQRMRARYRDRYQILLDEIGVQFGPRARTLGAPVGMHAMLAVRSKRTAGDIAGRAAALGVGVMPLDPPAGLLKSGETAFLIGFGNLADEEVRQGLAHLALAAD